MVARLMSSSGVASLSGVFRRNLEDLSGGERGDAAGDAATGGFGHAHGIFGGVFHAVHIILFGLSQRRKPVARQLDRF